MANPMAQQLDDKARELDQRIQDFFAKVNDVLSWVPGFLSDLIEPIIQGMDALRQKVEEFWQRLERIWNEPGDPDKLKQVGDEWTQQIGNAAGDIAGSISLDKLATNYDWTGKAAEAYKATVPAQVSGLGGIKDVAEQMKSSLSNLANAIENFHVALIAALVVFAVGAAGAIAAACTIVGTPAAIAALVGAGGVSLGLVVTAITAMQSQAQAIETEQGNIRQKIHDDLGNWEKSNIDALGHACVNDPSGMNWHIN
ncbi:MAG TPA: hypothetical protein VGJ13_18010 [Pseudonocardiaceae bacterium]